MTQPSDEDLVRLCRGGDRKAFEALVERHQRTVYNVALRMVRDPDEAADVAQSAFVKVYENLGSFDERYKFFSWLYKITVHEALNAVQRKKKFEGLDGLNLAAEQETSDEEEALERERKLRDALMVLSSDQRAVIVLQHFEGLSYGEIAKVLDIPEKKVKSRLFTARMVLRDLLVKRGLGNDD
jgi:RNA polymerase sigma-70 factor (ECF subfamily)